MAALGVCISGCDEYDDTELWNTVHDHEQRLAALEAWQAEVNNNISALQTLLNTNDLITSVVPVTRGETTIGYTISFLHSAPITIYNGKDGEKGETGAVPQIGLTQDEAGDWSWTLNGELMLDADGNPIRANGEDGKDGQDGQDGADGEDGNDGSTGATGPAGKPAPTPEISLGSKLPEGSTIANNEEIVPDAWYLRVEEGGTWYRVSGVNGDGLFFQEKPELSEDGNYYIFTLSDNTEIKVASYRTLTFEGINLDAPNPVTTGTLTFSYTAVDMDVRVATLISGDGWTAEASDGTIIVTAGDAAEAQLTLTVSDNKGYSASYIIEFYKCEYNEETHTYTVYNAEGLLFWADAVAKDETINCTLADDITLPAPEEGGSNWTPIKSLTGTFNGAGHTISGLVINNSYESSNVGFIEDLQEGGTVKNLMIKDAEINGYYAAGIANWVENNSKIVGCCFSGTVSRWGGYTGGIAGLTYLGSSIIGCYSTASVEGRPAGVVIGERLKSSIVTACYWSGEGVGIGRDYDGSGGTTQVTGTVTWESAIDEMNKAMEGESDYKWVLEGEYPTLKLKGN